MRKRDNTPSVLRDIPSTEERQHAMAARETAHPVMTVPRSFLIWRRVRIIAVIVLAVVALAAISLSVRHYVITTKSNRVIEEALKIETAGTYEKIKTAGEILSDLVGQYPSIDKVRSAHAWVLFVQARLFGPEAELLEKARQTLKGVEGDGSAIGLAAEAAHKSIQGEFEAASKITSKAILKYGKEPRLEMVRIWSLRAKGETDRATEKVEAAISTWPEYVPFSTEGVRLAVDTGDKEGLEKLTNTLDGSGSAHLWSSLGSLALLLPDWGEKIQRKRLGGRLVEVMDGLRSKIEAAPPKQRGLGTLLEGRINLVANRLEKASSLLSKSMNQDPNPETLGWLAFTAMKKDGCSSALRLLEKHSEMVTPGIMDVAARCSLKLHRLEKTSSLIADLEATNSLKHRVKNLKWGLSIRKGDLDTALSTMPGTIRPEQIWMALELYYLLKERGRRKDIAVLAGAFNESMKACGTSLKTWQNGWGRKTMKKMNVKSEDPCQAALTAKFFWGRLSPNTVMTAAELASKASGSVPMIEIQKAKAIWLFEGRKKAVAILDGIWESKPEGQPLRCELARAYLDMGIINKTLEVLEGEDHPEAIALKFFAKRALKEGSETEIVELARKSNKAESHPATTYVLAKNLYSQGKYPEAAELAEPALRGAGKWTSELAELAAKAISFSGDRARADRVLKDAERFVGTTAGLDELFEMKLVRANLNLRRGGSKFLNRATEILIRMRNGKIPDAEMLVGLSIVRLQNGNGLGARKLLREALEINPSLTKIYSQIKKNEQDLDEDTVQILKKTWPDWSP